MKSIFMIVLIVSGVSSRLPKDDNAENVPSVNLKLGKGMEKIEQQLMKSVNGKHLKQLNEIIDKVEQDGKLSPEEILKKFLHDPLYVKDFNISESGSFTQYDTDFTNMTLIGLKELKIRNMKIDLGKMMMNSTLDIPFIYLEGMYDLEGRMTFIPVSGNGTFWMNVTGLEIEVYSGLNMTENATIQISDILLDVKTKNIKMHFENLMGRSKWSSVANTLLNQLSGLLFDHIKYSLLDELEEDIKIYLNKKLERLPQISKERSANIFDEILDRVKQTMNESGLEPFNLPTFSENFNHNMLFFTIKGVAEIYNGKLFGLTTLMRTGDVIVQYEDNAVTFEANLGFKNLTGSYNWRANLMNRGPTGSSSLSISSISCHIKIRQALTKNSKPIIDQFKIVKIKMLRVDMKGLGSWDVILEVIINLISNALKSSLANAISGPIKNVIQKELNTLPIPLL